MKENRTIIRMMMVVMLLNMGALAQLFPTLSSQFSTFSSQFASAQIKIGGNVYGGGNKGVVKGSTKVTVKAGDIGAVIDPEAEATRPLADPKGKVFGGARMANVGGSSFVHIDGENASGYILINQVFGGNDIAGHIGTAAAVGEDIPSELTETQAADGTNEKKNKVDNTFNSYVRVSTKVEKVGNDTVFYTQEEITAAAANPEAAAYGKKTTDPHPDPTAKKVYIGQLFGGGNGDYDYSSGEYAGMELPELDKTYLEIKGGSIVYGYGGGNNATVREQNIIHFDNPSAVVNHILVDADGVEGDAAVYEAYGTNEANASYSDLLTEARFKEMGINTTFSQPSSGAFQVGRFFGGNNKAEMDIRPTWNLLAGKIRNLYSGGNRGAMTSPDGLLLEIKDYSTLIVDNLYGGCRMADVRPTVNGEYVPCTNLEGYYFPSELSARVLVSGGHINNVYGGNDVTGTVYGGNAVGIHTTVYGNVYGGGNGAYPYTSTETYKNEDTYGDFYFDPGNNAMDALKAFRPNAEQVSLHLWGESSTKPTVIHGSVFVGGNCASLAVKKSQPLIELKIGSHVIADNVYLGNNGEGMIDKSYLKLYAEGGLNSWGLTDHVVFGQYMEGVAMTLMPSIVFDSKANGDKNDYSDYSSFIGSFFCGGNVGSMAIPGKMTFNITRGLNIYNKFVGGCNNANVAAGAYNAAYNGGIIGSPEERDNYTDEAGNIRDRLEINFQNMTVVPMRWNNTLVPITSADIKDGKLIEGKEYYTSDLQETKFVATGEEPVDLDADDKYYKMTVVGKDFEWNTGKYSTVEDEYVKVGKDAVDNDTRLLYGNVYGGCYNSGHVNGNVILNINDDVLKKDEIFGEETSTLYGYQKSGVSFEDQREDVMTSALYVYGAGHGVDTDIWGSTTINHNNGYVFQVFGGGEEGAVGKKQINLNQTPVLDEKGNYIYTYDPKYSTTVNLNGTTTIYSHEGTVENLAESEYLYGGGNQGIIAGNTLVNLGNGRIYDAFGGSSDADILGHAEVYIGRQPNGSGGYKDGFPWIKDNIYGGNDFGGTIHGAYEDGFDFTSRVRDYENDKTQIHGYKAGEIPDVLNSSTYVEYLQGRVDSIFGGSYGYYDYSNTELYGEGCAMPKQKSAFVNIRPKDHVQNNLLHAYGAGTGHPGNREDDASQDRSYVLVDIPDGMTNFSTTEVFGAGSYNGLGMGYTPEETFDKNFDLDKASAVIDLLRGRIGNAYGGSYQEGITRRTVVNVPEQSSIQIDNIFGGAYGLYILPPCDVYETQVNYKNTSEKALVFGAIYGGNNNERRSLFTQVNISSPVYSNKEKGYTGTVYGAGRGIDTWSEHTEVNLLKGARVYNVYGGGEVGHVLNAASVQAYQNLYKDGPSPQIGAQDTYWKEHLSDLTTGTDESKAAALARWQKEWKNTWTIGSYYEPNGTWTDYAANKTTNLSRFSDRPELDDNTAAQLDGQKKHNTNVIVNEGAVVEGYAYGGGLGDKSVALSGDVYGTTYIAVLGGEVKKDVYAGGRAGGLDNLFGAESFSGGAFTATANAYIQGGTARNVYGGGYEGHVGHHDGAISTSYTGDRPAEAYVVIGKQGTNTYTGGAPAITRNVYGGGEGGSIYGSSKVTINNGYIGYRYEADGSNGAYVEELDDQKPGDLELSGNVFGGGYVANSYVDNTTVNMYGGTVRGSLYGGGEIGPIGRGSISGSGGLSNGDAHIYRAGTTNVYLYDGKVKRNVFGGGRGKDSWGGDGTMYMDPAVVATLDMKCKGFVFGQTRVNIHGGEIGTAEGMAYGYGNVFGGGDEGSVYSAYIDTDGTTKVGNFSGTRYDEGDEGYYYKHSGSNFILSGDKKVLTEDCKVVVEPYAMAQVDITVGENSYKARDYVKTSDLNLLKGKNPETGAWESPEWGSLDSRGVIIHNAVFAGGNISSGSNTQNANEKTVFGNATASIHDVYNRDLITIGTGHTGGLYGDGNLTFVDGYRELNITNYGTDYHHIKKQLTYDEYKLLPEREQAYYELKYKCLVECVDIDGTTYSVGSNLPMDELLAQFTDKDGNSLQVGGVDVIITEEGKKVPNPAIWQENGVVTAYAGRIMNTIQRADFCGVFGSRMVMKGAPDRVPEEADYTNYTINRVREVSLNKKESIAGDTDDDNKEHGNYFGIYSVVNYLGALTSDVRFGDVRTHKNKNKDFYDPDYDPSNTTVSLKTGLTDDEKDAVLAAAAAIDGVTVSGENITASTVEALYKLRSVQGLNIVGEKLTNQTFYDWKKIHHNERKRNNGSCHNQLALASGVYLELTSEKSTGNTVDTKDWGLITGVIELDLINVQPGIGGGFVYAKNEHGEPTGLSGSINTLTALNSGAATKGQYTYATADGSRHEWETTGNFIHSTQTIIDDCYNVSNSYLSTNFVKAHYWYIAGSVFVYDQYISAYTGSPNAFSETVEIPISITAASNGAMTLVDVQPNYYAYYKDASMSTPLSDDQKLVINDVTYQLNDPISYWEYNKLTAAQQKMFVSETYVTSAGSRIGNDTIYAGTVMLPADYNTYYGNAETKEIDEKDVKAVFSNGKYVPFEEIFHSSNNMSHNTGYLLTYSVTNPAVWNKWYTNLSEKEKIKLVEYSKKSVSAQAAYTDGPTYTPTKSGLYGQRNYAINAIISDATYSAYEALGSNKPTSDDQAEFKEAYIVTKECTSNNQHYYPGAPVSAVIPDCTAPAYVSTATIQLSPTEYIYVNDLLTADDIADYKSKYLSSATAIDELVKPAYICTTAGKYGGSYYEVGKNYRALEAYSAMSPEDRENFTFNYDALDLLIDPDYSYGSDGTRIHPTKKLYQYDGKGYTTADDAKNNLATYSLPTPIDYTATYNGTTDETAHNGIKLTNRQDYDRADYEKLPNEQRHYAPIAVSAAGGEYHVVKESFIHGYEAFAVGNTIDEDKYKDLSEDEISNYITTLNFTGTGKDQTYYYCREEYQIGEKTEGVKPAVVTGITDDGGIVTREGKEWVTVGTIINATTDGDNYGYASLPNYQKNFTIHGTSPTETSTLYVARGADINDLSKEKIITVIYQYDYEESDESGEHITPVTERHVVNIHVTFKSGVPTVEDINPPTIVLPGTGITMRVPTVTPGAYEIIGGGWELFESPSDAESHINGVAYTPSVDPLYWYQDGFYLAYYAKTYLGRTYSNHVPVSVANYHDLKRVMDDKTTHLHVDYDRNRLKRDSKIYINDYSASGENGLDLFKNLYDLSVLSGSPAEGSSLAGHSPLNNNTEEITLSDGTKTTKGVKGGQNLEFILRTDIYHGPTTIPNPAYNPDDPESSETISEEHPWTPIGTDDQCFEGNLHGDGHTISGLDKSLFYNLCGNVYNLGVTGSFNTAGVVDKGTGYVESAWVKTTNDTPLGSKPYAVFGNPTDTGSQLVNSYFCEDNKNLFTTTETAGVTTSGGDRGKARAMTAKEFYNGTVAYDLNNFYLYKRYSDQKVTSGDEDERYSYFTIGNDGKLVLQNNHYYTANAELCSTGHKDQNGNAIMYVEDRFADGDFVFAAGEIPTTAEERQYTWTVTNPDTGMEKVESTYFPIWPDDYIFFGQKLTYGWAAQAHQNVPTAVVRSGGRLSTADDANRVYRAPAYYRSKAMGVAHFNPHAYLAQKERLTTAQIEYNVTPREAYPNMTAIDFKGHNDLDYQLGLEDGKFYTPLLDDDGLLSIQNCDETQNLLAYAPSADVNAKTHGVLNSYFTEPVYSEHYDNNAGYRLVTEATAASVHGHLVQSDLTATIDHLLVDKQDFNAPLAYKFDADHLMWYQRLPSDKEYVDLTKGWQGISIPFTAELVTTDTKGEITHFFSGSTKGHEYWLREFKDGGTTDNDNGVYKAAFDYPNATGPGKTDTNTFLWDYYYKNESVHNQKDKNDDTYLQYRQYYNSSRTYAGYPLLAAATPYILGLPGQTYYEFDLSGKFTAQNTAAAITKLGKQTITFASNKGARIKVSDDEMKDAGVSYDNYTFRPSYMNKVLENGNYVINNDGSAYVKLAAPTVLSAFRPYFTASAPSGSRQYMAKKIVFGDADSQFGVGPESALDSSLEIYARGRIIVTRSHMKEPVAIRIINAAGITLTNFILQPGETIETPIRFSGVYIVNNKKVFVVE